MNTNLKESEMLKFLKDRCGDALRITLTTSKGHLTKFQGNRKPDNASVDTNSSQCREAITPSQVERAYKQLGETCINKVVVFWGTSVDWKAARFTREGDMFIPETESTKQTVLNWREG